MAKDPLNSFHLALGKTKTTDLIDLRNIKSPFLQMAFQDERDICVNLRFIHSENSNINKVKQIRIFIWMGIDSRKLHDV